jgi:hypothetical protein
MQPVLVELERDLKRAVAPTHCGRTRRRLAAAAVSRRRPRARARCHAARRRARSRSGVTRAGPDDDPLGEHSGPPDAPRRARVDLAPKLPAARVGHAGHAVRRGVYAGGRRL